MPRIPVKILLRILISLALVACAILAVLVVDFEMLRTGPFWEKYQQVEFRMTQKQAEEILGPPNHEADFGGFGADHLCLWLEGRKAIAIYFNDVGTEDGRPHWGVSEKVYHPRTAWELLCRYFRR
jgi:hypothetical protein